MTRTDYCVAEAYPVIVAALEANKDVTLEDGCLTMEVTAAELDRHTLRLELATSHGKASVYVEEPKFSNYRVAVYTDDSDILLEVFNPHWGE